MAYHRRSRRKPMAQINVVPYIDVMLVLLVIFMVTAPKLQEGVEVNLPQATARPVDSAQDKDRIVVAVDARGRLYLDRDGPRAAPLSPAELASRVAALLEGRKDRRAFVRADRAVDYGAVIQAMTALQAAGAERIGLLTEPPHKKQK